MMPAITFRAAALQDIPAVVALVESAYRGDASRAGWTTEADFLEGQRIDAAGVKADIETPHNRVLLAEGDGGLLACCHLQKTGDACYFGMFSVSPGLQGGGIGKQLIAEAERIAREDWRCTRMQMTVIDIRAELIGFYERRGYVRTGVHKPFPYGDARFGIPLRDDLRFEVLEKPLA
jgi:ribosomal protein S18 acetylase RimI-like enzyme